MKCFQLNEFGITKGIPVILDAHGVPAIQVATAGTLGERVFVNLYAGHYGLNPERMLFDCSLNVSKRSGRKLIVKPQGEDQQQALVLAQFPIPKTTTGVAWSGVATERKPCVLRGRPVTQFNTERRCHRCYSSINRSSIHAEEGSCLDWPYFPSAGVEIVAERFCRFYLGGDLGDYPERLIVMSPGSAFRVTLLPVDDMARSESGGDVNFLPAFRRYVRWTGTELKLGSFQELFPEVLTEMWESNQL